MNFKNVFWEPLQSVGNRFLSKGRNCYRHSRFFFLGCERALQCKTDLLNQLCLTYFFNALQQIICSMQIKYAKFSNYRFCSDLPAFYFYWDQARKGFKYGRIDTSDNNNFIFCICVTKPSRTFIFNMNIAINLMLQGKTQCIPKKGSDSSSFFKLSP